MNIFTNRGVAQLVAREVWDFDAVGSNPATPTKIAVLTAKSKPQGKTLRLCNYGFQDKTRKEIYEHRVDSQK